MTAIGADPSSGVRDVRTAGLGGGSFTAHVNLASGRPCRSLAIQASTLSPGLCAGPAGETAWTEPYGGDTIPSDQTVHYTSLAEGDCQLALGAAGATGYPTIIHFPIRVATDFTAAHTAEPNYPCPTEGATACLSSFLCVETCRGGGWSEPSICPQGQACEVLPSGTGGCTASAGCARCR